MGGAETIVSEDIASDEQVHFFPSYATYTGSGWQAHIHNWVFEPEFDSLIRRPIRSVIRMLVRDAVNEATRPIFEERVGWFLVDNERNKQLTLVAPLRARTPDTASDGHAKMTIHIPALRPVSKAPVMVPLRTAPTRDGRVFKSRIIGVPPIGVSVISDIDDTIKHTNVLDTKRMIRNTLVYRYREVQVLRKLYANLLKKGVAFHYVSSSPWFMSALLERFFTRVGLPYGSMHLKAARLTGLSVLKLFESSRESKPPVIEKILRDFPGRRFVLVGDAGESDPEIYREVARRHPKQIAYILIRRIRMNETEDRRLGSLYRGWPPNRWGLIDDSVTDITPVMDKVWEAVNSGETPRPAP